MSINIETVHRVLGGRRDGVRNPFQVIDPPLPDDLGATAFAASVDLTGSADDDNARCWHDGDRSTAADLDGDWFSRWNGGADPTIPGDANDKWKHGAVKLRMTDDRIYLLFTWDDGRRIGLIDARRNGARNLAGKYINLTAPEIVRPWAGLIVDTNRIDGRWTNGRLDFRR